MKKTSIEAVESIQNRLAKISEELNHIVVIEPEEPTAIHFNSMLCLQRQSIVIGNVVKEIGGVILTNHIKNWENGDKSI